MSNLAKHIHDEKNGLDYTLYGDYYLPDLGVEPGYLLGKYGMMRMQYLKEHRPGLYTRLLLSGKLNDDLHQADVQAQHLLDTMIPQMAKDAGVTEQMKMTDQLRWVGIMNNIKNQVEEIIWNRIIYLYHFMNCVDGERLMQKKEHFESKKDGLYSP